MSDQHRRTRPPDCKLQLMRSAIRDPLVDFAVISRISRFCIAPRKQLHVENTSEMELLPHGGSHQRERRTCSTREMRFQILTWVELILKSANSRQLCNISLVGYTLPNLSNFPLKISRDKVKSYFEIASSLDRQLAPIWAACRSVGRSV